MGIRYFVVGWRLLNFFTTFFVLIEFHSNYEPSCLKFDFSTNLSKFLPLFNFFHILVNFLQILDFGKVIQ